MRIGVAVAAIGVVVAVCADAQQIPSESQVVEAQKRTDELALRYADRLADRVRFTLGYLNGRENLVIHRWDEAVRQWKKEAGHRAEPLLAEGVLFDCLGRMRGVVTRPISNERRGPFFGDLADQRPGRAAAAFERALKINPRLVEARLRAARIKAQKPEAARELEEIVEGGAFPFSYLAAVSRAEAARAAGDRGGAATWYEKALALNPRSAAAAIGLATLKGTAVAFDDLNASDIYYSYPCTVLTPDVDAELSARVQNVVLKPR